MIKTVKKGSNSKVGKGVSLTYREVGPTCPSTCQHLKSRSCYALYAFVNIHQKKSGYDQSDGDRVAEFINQLPDQQIIRHHVSGDFLKPEDQIDDEYIDSVLGAHQNRPDLMGWTYTHAWKRLDSNRMNTCDSLCVNASCDSEEEVEDALKKGWPSTMTVPEDQESYLLDSGTRVVICPNQTHEVTCKECMLCFRKQRKCVVAFRLHGTGKGKYNASNSKQD